MPCVWNILLDFYDKPSWVVRHPLPVFSETRAFFVFMSLCLQTVDTKVVLNRSNTVEQVLSWGRVGPSQLLNGAPGSARTCFSLCIQ